MFISLQLALKQTYTTASQIMIKGVGQPDGLIFHKIPTGMESSNVVTEITG